jgi:hypothetical protein
MSIPSNMPVGSASEYVTDLHAPEREVTGDNVPGPDEPSLTRAAVAAMVGCSVATVRRAEETELHPVTDARGVRWFTREEAEAFAAKWKTEERVRLRRPRQVRASLPRGELEARIFRSFDAGELYPAQLVLKYRVPIAEIRRLYREYSLSLPEGERLRVADARRARQQESERQASAILDRAAATQRAEVRERETTTRQRVVEHARTERLRIQSERERARIEERRRARTPAEDE